MERVLLLALVFAERREIVDQFVGVVRVITTDLFVRRHHVEGRWERCWDSQRFPIDTGDHEGTPRLFACRSPDDGLLLVLCRHTSKGVIEAKGCRWA